MSGTYQVTVTLRKRELKDGAWTGAVEWEEECGSAIATEDEDEARTIFGAVSGSLAGIARSAAAGAAETKPSSGCSAMGEYCAAHARAKEQAKPEGM